MIMMMMIRVAKSSLADLVVKASSLIFFENSYLLSDVDTNLDCCWCCNLLVVTTNYIY